MTQSIMSTVIFIYMPSRQNNSTNNPQTLKMGEEKAFEYFFRQYYSALCFFANSIIRDEDEARDIVQDCFIKLWDCQTINERSETVKSFLYTTVRNKCVDFLRKRKTMEKATFHIARDREFNYFDEGAFAEMIRQVEEYLAEFSPKIQKIIKLYYVDGKKYHEIAGEVKSTPEAVRKQKARALQIIRKKFLSLFL